MSSQNNFSNLYTKKEANKPAANVLGCAAAAALAQIRAVQPQIAWGCQLPAPPGCSAGCPHCQSPDFALRLMQNPSLKDTVREGNCANTAARREHPHRVTRWAVELSVLQKG